MLTLDEMMLEAGNGAIVAMVSRQFDLTRDQTVSAIRALLPAFSQSLKRTAATPQGIAPFMEALAGGQHADYMKNITRAFTPAGMQDGREILSHLFGSRELAGAVVEHAARNTGLSGDKFEQMMPPLAAMMMGGFYQQMMGWMPQPDRREKTAADFPAAVIMRQMMDFYSGQKQNPEPDRFDPYDNPFTRAFQQVANSGAADVSADENANPYLKMFQQMIAATLPNDAPAEESGNDKQAEQPSPIGKDFYSAMFGEMFEVGNRIREDQQKAVEALFDQYLKPDEPRR